MANLVYNTAKKEMWDGTVDLLVNTIKVMLVSTAVVYTPNADDDVVDAAGANDPVDAETNVTNYARGFGAAGRKTLASKAIVTDKPNDRAEFDAADVTWTALGNATNQTVEAAILIKEGGVDDTTSRLIGYVDFTNFTTNGADVTLQWDAEGIMQLSSLFGALQLARRALADLWSWISESMSHETVEKAKSLGLRPHIVRHCKPLTFRGAVNG